MEQTVKELVHEALKYDGMAYQQAMTEFEKVLFKEALKDCLSQSGCAGIQAKVARKLGINRAILRNKLKDYELL